MPDRIDRRSLSALGKMATTGAALFLLSVLPGNDGAADTAGGAVSAVIDLHLVPGAAEPGDVVLIMVGSRRPEGPPNGLNIRFGEVPIAVFEDPRKDRRSLMGLIAVPYQSDPGTKTIAVEWRAGTQRRRRVLPLEIVSGRFKSEKLTVDPSRMARTPREMDRIKREREEVDAVYAHSYPKRLWSEAFQRPVGGKVTSPFGSRRVFNGTVASYHCGVDFRAATGSPVRAANAGIVSLAKNLFFAGNVIILDHGKGLFTTYAHLSRMSVSPGHFVEKGRVIGLAGATGRVTGPHLHWGVTVNGVAASPLKMMRTLSTLFPNQTTGSDPL